MYGVILPAGIRGIWEIPVTLCLVMIELRKVSSDVWVLASDARQTIS